MKTFIIISLVVLILASAGGGAYYYYTEFYLPKEYARQVLPLYDKFRGREFTSDAGIKDAADVEGSLRLIEARRTAGRDIQDALSKIKPPKKTAKIHDDFSGLMRRAFEANGHAESLLRFFQKAAELRVALKVAREPPSEAVNIRPETATISILQRQWQEPMAKSVTLGNELFGGAVPDLGDATLGELKSSWATVGPDIEFVRGLIMSFRPTILLSQIEGAISKTDGARAEKTFKEVEDFEKKLGAVVAKMNARDIASGRYYTGASQAEMSDLYFRVSTAMENMKKGYGL